MTMKRFPEPNRMDYIDPHELVLDPDHKPSPRDLKQQIVILTREGQIEPLCIDRETMMPRTSPIDVYSYSWGNERIMAARQLGWNTVLVCFYVQPTGEEQP